MREALLVPAQPALGGGARRRRRPRTTSVGRGPGPTARRPTPSTSGCPHWEIGAELGLLDMERGAKLSGSMFPLYRGVGARLLRALTAFALDRHADDYEEIRPPTLVLTETMVSTGHLPKFADDAYHIERDDLWAIPTAEVPAHLDVAGRDPRRGRPPAAAHRGHRLLPARGRAPPGRDTRGLLRVHEFDKVELFAYTTPEQAPGAARRHGGAGRGAAAGARSPVPGPRPVHRRSRQLGGPHLRPRGLRARASTSGSRSPR